MKQLFNVLETTNLGEREFDDKMEKIFFIL